VTTNYSYDVFGNLKSVILPSGQNISYITDGFNHRVGKLVNGVRSKFWVYESKLKLAAELDANGSLVTRFIYGIGHAPEAMVKGNVTYQFITDHLGSVRMVMNSLSGEVVQKIDYDEFGQVLADSNPGFQPFGFAGGIYDSDIKLVRFGARDYDAEVGRFTAKDPLLFGGGLTNLYGYVNNDPINFIDPSGLYFTFRNLAAEALFNKTYAASLGPARALLDRLIKDKNNEIVVGVMCDKDLQKKAKGLGVPYEVDGLTTGNPGQAPIIDISSFSQNPRTLIHEIGHAEQLINGMSGSLPEGMPNFLENFVGGY
jgi:RHS repeat-associated protein